MNKICNYKVLLIKHETLRNKKIKSNTQLVDVWNSSLNTAEERISEQNIQLKKLGCNLENRNGKYKKLRYRE